MGNMSVVEGLGGVLDPLIEVLEDSGRSAATGHACIEGVSRVVPRLTEDISWLPEAYRSSSPGQSTTTQFLLARAADRSWCVVSVVWPGRVSTPIHDHGIWGVSAQLVGHLVEVRYRRSSSGSVPLSVHSTMLCDPGHVSTVVPPFDVHSVLNPLGTDAVALQIYGRDLASVDRRIFELETGRTRPYVTTYDELPATD